MLRERRGEMFVWSRNEGRNVNLSSSYLTLEMKLWDSIMVSRGLEFEKILDIFIK